MGSSDDVVHDKKSRSWWDGALTTWCGLKWESGSWGTSGWLSGGTACPACKAAQQASKK